jgi:hypothetical protein
VRLAVTPSWHAGQVCSGGAAGLGPPDASGAGAILSSQHSGHSTCGRPCRPCPCSHTKYAAPATSSKLRPPPKGSPGALGMRRCIAVHLSLDKAARPGTIAGADPFQCGTIRPIDGKACRRCPRPPMWPASLTAAGSGDVSPGCRSASVTLRYQPWSLIARGIRRYARPPAVGLTPSTASRIGCSAAGQPRRSRSLGPSWQLQEEAGSMAGGSVQVSVPECAVAMPGAMARPSPLLPVRRGVPFQRPARRAASRPGTPPARSPAGNERTEVNATAHQASLQGH